MFPRRYYAGRYFAPRYFPESQGDDPVPGPGGSFSYRKHLERYNLPARPRYILALFGF